MTRSSATCQHPSWHGLPAHAHEAQRSHSAFTLVEVLAALMLIAIVIPVVMQGITVAANTASAARHRNEATGLAESKLAEIVATAQWQTGTLAGDFSPDWPDYRWEATVQPWAQDTSDASLQQIDLRLIWNARGRENSLTLSTLAYDRSQQ